MPVDQFYDKVRGFIRRDTRANQPLVADVLVGTLYYVTDENVLERSNGSVWEDCSSSSGSGSIGLRGMPGIDGNDGEDYEPPPLISSPNNLVRQGSSPSFGKVDLTGLEINALTDPGFVHSNTANNTFAFRANGGIRMDMDWNSDSGVEEFLVRKDGGATELFSMKENGSSQMHLYGAGAATFDASGNITSVSDERLKNIKGEYKIGLKELMGISPIEFKYNALSGLDTENTYTGFSAQNVMKFIPEAVGKNNDGYYSLNDRTLLAAAINAIKTLKSEIDELRSALSLQPKDYNPKIRNYYETGIIKSKRG